MASKQVVVVGGGIAGCSAALEVARLGLKVMLIDEHPQTMQAMSLDAPYFYGTRLAAILDDVSVTSERVLGANDLLMKCLEADIEVLPSTSCWGSFVPGPNNVNLTAAQIGLADAERSWLAEYDYLILAPGGRDLVLSFPGWHLPGVLAANAAAALLERYQAMSSSRMVVLGTNNLALRTARAAIDKGINVVAIVEPASQVRGDRTLAAELERDGVPVLLSHTIERALGEQEVRGVRIVEIALRAVGSTAREIACDTVCLAFGIVPNVELASVSGCRIVFDEARGGWVPDVDGDFRTSIPNIFVVGEAAGTSDELVLDPTLAAEQGRRAARAIAVDEGLAEPASMPSSASSKSNQALPSAKAWLDSLVVAGGMDVVVCQCEEVTRRELLEVSPPKYLGAGNMRSCGGVTELSAAGKSSQDLIKRLTRAGMGHCQGKRCREQTIMLLAAATGTELSKMVPGSYRMPVRPIPLSVMWANEETEETRRNWPIWLHPVEEGAPGYASAKAAETNRAKR